MTDMPPLQFAPTNGIRMGYHEAGPTSALPPVVLCHGWPEIAFSWRHQIQALAAAGIRVIAPDQRGYGATERPLAPPSAADGMERLVPDLDKVLVGDSGHWTQQEKPQEVSDTLIEWHRRRFGTATP